MSSEPENPIVSREQRFKTYSVNDYIEYCEAVRSSLEVTAGTCHADHEFFRKKFVDEMEVLAKVCEESLGRTNDVLVRYMDEQLADGEIIFNDPSKSFFVEITSSKDHRLIDFAVAQLKVGRLISISGHSGDDVPRLHKERGNEVVAEEVTDIYEKQRVVIENRIQKKLNKEWQNRDNWLCVVVDDLSYWDEFSGLSLTKIAEQFSASLRAQFISKLWFIGYDRSNPDLPLVFDT